MKLSSPLLFLVMALLSAALIGCRREKTEPFGPDLAAARAPLALSAVREADSEALEGLALGLLASFCETHTDDFQADLLGPQVLLTLLLNASENESLEKLSAAMKVPEGRHDLYTKSLQAKLDHLRGMPGNPARQGTALWMIWPILLTPDFQNEMGDKLGASIYRLGSAGITASNRIKTWQKKVGAAPTQEFDLDKKEVMTATTSLILNPGEWKSFGSVDLEGRRVSYFASSRGLEMALITGDDLPSFFKAQRIISSRSRAKGAADLPSFPASKTKLKHRAGFERAGFDFVFDQSNDWRYLSMELRQTGLSSIVCSADLALPEEGAPMPTGGVYVIYEPKSELLLAGGRLPN